jgi:hypothetical protein
VEAAAGVGGGGRDGADDLAFEALGVDPALAGDRRVGGTEAGVEVEELEDVLGAGTKIGAEGRAEASGEAPAQPVIGTPRGSRGSSVAKSWRRPERRATAASSAPFCGAKTRAAPIAAATSGAAIVPLKESGQTR